MELAAVDLVAQRHHDERVEDDREVDARVLEAIQLAVLGHVVHIHPLVDYDYITRQLVHSSHLEVEFLSLFL